MQLPTKIQIIGWGDVPTDPSYSFTNPQVQAMIESSIEGWLAKPNKTGEELALVEQRQKDLAEVRAMTDTSWEETTGIVTRQYIMDDAIGTTELALVAARNAIAVAEKNDSNFSVDKISIVVSGGASFADAYPGCSCIMQDRLGIPRAAGLDLTGACCSGTEALIVASGLMQFRSYSYALVALGEKMGSWCDDRLDKNGLLWGDGGGAVILSGNAAGNRNFGLLGFDMLSYGHLAHTTRSRGIGAHPDHRRFPAPNASMEGHGHDLQRWVTRDVAKHLRDYLTESGLEINDRTFLLPHNGNIKMVNAVGERSGIPPERILHRIAERGNQSSASVFSTLSKFANAGHFRRGDLLIFATFGGGAKHNFVTYRWGI